MTWVKHDDTYAEHPDWFVDDEQVGALALALDVAATSYCSRQRTDGQLGRVMARRLLVLEDPDRIIDYLVSCGRWRLSDAGYELVDYLVNQPSKERVEEQQKLKRERQQRWLDGKRGASQRSSQDASQDGAPPRPAPPRRKAGAGRGGDAAASAGAPATAAPFPRRGTTPFELGIVPTVTVEPFRS